MSACCAQTAVRRPAVTQRVASSASAKRDSDWLQTRSGVSVSFSFSFLLSACRQTFDSVITAVGGAHNSPIAYIEEWVSPLQVTFI